MSSDIKIKAQPAADLTRCEFQVDRPVFPGGAVLLRSGDDTEGSPLAETLLGLEGVISASFAGSTVVVNRDPSLTDDWLPLARQIGAAIRTALQADVPPLAPSLAERGGDETQLRSDVQGLLDGEINPMVASHGGFIEVVDVRGQDLWLKMGGGCQGCGSAAATLREGVERLLRERLPHIGAIHDATDHAAGENPYFAPSS